ncbi:MAG TPA: hypothetical protein VIH36_05435 [Casimicrobiaceae bacterium]
MLFAGIAAIPSAHPPEGLVAAVLAALPQRPPSASAEDADDESQPFAGSRVIGATSADIPAGRRGRMTGSEPVSQSGFYFRGESMSEQNSRFSGRRNMWIGGGVATVAAVLLVSFGMNIPPKSTDTAGTIAPAQRYRAQQDMSDNVNGAPGTAQATQGLPSAQNALGAEANAVNNATNSATAKAVDSATAKAVDSATAKAVDSATAKAVDSATAKAVDSATQRAVDNSTAKAVDSATQRAVNNSTAKAVDSATAKATNSATAKAVDSASAKAVDSATAKAVDSATAKAVDSATAKAVDNATIK